MTENKCPQCGAPLDPGATECKFCGEKIATQQAAQSAGTASATGYHSTGGSSAGICNGH